MGKKEEEESDVSDVEIDDPADEEVRAAQFFFSPASTSTHTRRIIAPLIAR